MNIKKPSVVFSMASSLALAGCDFVSTNDDTMDVSETSSQGIVAEGNNWTENLTDNTYYIVHNNIYYPVFSDIRNEAAEDTLEVDEQVNPNRMYFFTTENENEIPTLYKGDKLIYYSTTNLLDYITWERYYDLGYTLGFCNIEHTTSNRCYVDLNADDYSILPDESLTELTKETADQIMIDKIGPTQITPDMVEYGIITNLKKDAEYDLDLYAGTIYKQCHTTANYHAFHSFEWYASVNYTTKQEYIYEIEIPDYFVSGYYNIGDVGFFRYVADGTSYDKNTNFNECLLYQSDGEYDPDSTEEYIYTYTPPYCYSECEELNYYKTDIIDAFGYVDPETEFMEEDSAEISTPSKHQFIESIENQYKLKLPKDTVCKIIVTSPTKEKTGVLTVTFHDKTTQTTTYDSFNGNYTLELDGHGDEVILTIAGFYSGYDVSLVNAQFIQKIDQASNEDTQVNQE